MEIKAQFLIVSFIHKIIVCDVYTLKHLFKIKADERAYFDSFIYNSGVSQVLKITYVDD